MQFYKNVEILLLNNTCLYLFEMLALSEIGSLYNVDCIESIFIVFILNDYNIRRIFSCI